MEIEPNKWKSIRTNGNRTKQMEIDPNKFMEIDEIGPTVSYFMIKCIDLLRYRIRYWILDTTILGILDDMIWQPRAGGLVPL